MSETERWSALKNRKDCLDFWGQDQPKCPHCGDAVDVSDNDLWRIYEEGEHEVDCPHCENEFSVSTRVSYSFDTDQQEMDDDD